MQEPAHFFVFYSMYLRDEMFQVVASRATNQPKHEKQKNLIKGDYIECGYSTLP